MLLINLELLLPYLLFETLDLINDLVYPFLILFKMLFVTFMYLIKKSYRILYLIFYYIPKKLYSFKKYLTPFMQDFIVNPLVDFVHSITLDLQSIFTIKKEQQIWINNVRTYMSKNNINKISYCIVKKVN